MTTGGGERPVNDRACRGRNEGAVPVGGSDEAVRSVGSGPLFVRPDVLCGTGRLLAVARARFRGPVRTLPENGGFRVTAPRKRTPRTDRRQPGSGLAGNGCFGCSGDAGVGRIGAGLRDAGLRCGVRFGERFRRVVAGEFERAGRMAALGLEPGRAAQPFADADDVVVARAEAFVGVLVGVAGLAEGRADPLRATR